MFQVSRLHGINTFKDVDRLVDRVRPLQLRSVLSELRLLHPTDGATGPYVDGEGRYEYGGDE